MIRPPPISTRTYTLFPDTTLFRAFEVIAEVGGDVLVVFDDEDAHGFGCMPSRGSDRGGVLLSVSCACSLARSRAATVMHWLLDMCEPVFFTRLQTRRLFSPASVRMLLISSWSLNTATFCSSPSRATPPDCSSVAEIRASAAFTFSRSAFLISL